MKRDCPCCGRPFETTSKDPAKLCSPACMVIKGEWETSQTTMTLRQFFERYYNNLS